MRTFTYVKGKSRWDLDMWPGDTYTYPDGTAYVMAPDGELKEVMPNAS